jgi:phosphoglycolate phosphatase-like HAD superfamily hydrolase
MTAPATSAELEALIGEADPLIIERILETGATTEEVTEALADLEDERQGAERREVTSPRVATVREILDELLDEDADEFEAMYGHPV